jgi:chloramphenicol O-acetyltransferase
MKILKNKPNMDRKTRPMISMEHNLEIRLEIVLSIDQEIKRNASFSTLYIYKMEKGINEVFHFALTLINGKQNKICV